MKTFKIAKSNFRLNGIIMPINAVYGCIVTRSGKKEIFTNKGKVYTKLKNYEHIIYYMCDDFQPVIMNGHKHYYVHIYDQYKNRWNDFVCTAQSPMYYDLADMLTKKLSENNISPDTKCISAMAYNKPIRKHKTSTNGFYIFHEGKNTTTDYACGKMPRWVDWK